MSTDKSALPENALDFAYLNDLNPEQIAGIQRAAGARAMERSWDVAMRKHAPSAQTPARRPWTLR